MSRITIVIDSDEQKAENYSNSPVPVRKDFNTVAILSDLTISPHSSVEVFRIDTPVIPESRRSLRVVNTGLASSVTAKFYWSHSFTSEWFESGSMDVGLGEDKVLNVPSNSFYYSKFIIYNNTDKVAYVTANLV
ncbi:hypothetical protein [Photorhabdus heterorhabditis]|uniref:JHE-like toxin PirA n=1 Tax=Photorhabdus heterorhabditis TaxID=880156 RepID=A0A5B0XBZ5_9GAMM|nr:hypothetical protein [Photorhabdus heterorhabditis]KAA1195639.1 hypothetical protein F0L16_00490 [Photorhabdus heterorhabditis]MBS9440869.1 hypothetical protein [Photorhabdus heterorhabditis]